METVKIYQAKTHFSALVDRANAGEKIIIAKGDKPVAMLVPIGSQLEPRQPMHGLVVGNQPGVRQPAGLLTGSIDWVAWKEADKEIEDMIYESLGLNDK